MQKTGHPRLLHPLLLAAFMQLILAPPSNQVIIQDLGQAKSDHAGLLTTATKRAISPVCASVAAMDARVETASLMYNLAVFTDNHLPRTAVMSRDPYCKKCAVAPPLRKE